jgi:FAD/FMN-containing dehydrogenase
MALRFRRAAAPSAHDHERIVAAIAARVRAMQRAGAPVHIAKGGVHHVVPLPHDRRFTGAPIDVSGLDRILAIDASAGRCVAEPGVTFAELVRATLPHGLVPAVVPELEGITLGGAVAGCSVESMSFRHGGFHDTCLEYEVVTGAGDVLTLSPERDPELFHMIHGSYGTLAILTRLTFRLVRAKPYVKLSYRRVASYPEFETELLTRARIGDYDFLDAIVHGPRTFVLCLGRFVDEAPYTSSYRGTEIYYQSTARRPEDYLTTFDYCFRYDTDCHWLTRTLPPLTWRPTRRWLGRLFLGSSKLIAWSRRLGPLLRLHRRPDVVVDVFIPARRLGDFWWWYEEHVRHYPLWVVPYRVPGGPYPWIDPAHAARMEDDLFIDCGVYGKPNRDPEIDWSQALEDKTYELGGVKTLISRNHHSRERFWQIYHRDAYDAAKRRLDPRGAFKNLYDKFHVSAG